MSIDNTIHIVYGRVPQYNFPALVMPRRWSTEEIKWSDEEIKFSNEE